MLADIAARTALVLETNNIQGGRVAELPGASQGRAQTEASLLRVIGLLAAQSLPPAALAQFVVTHDGLSQACCDEARRLAGCTIDFIRVAFGTGYYAAKNAGFAATDARRCDYVAFADADCVPDAGWLAQLLAPFATEPAVASTEPPAALTAPPAAVAGRTSYCANVTGAALTTLDFMYFPSPLRAGATRNFYANNVAFRRDVFEQYRYQALDGVYRAHCQVLGLRLQQANVVMHYAPAAHTEHRLPDTHWQTLKLRWMRGQDSVGLTPYLVRAHLPRALQWLGRSGPVGPLCVMASRVWFSVRALNHQHLPPLRGLRWLGGMALILGFSLIDALGALTGGLGLRSTRPDADAKSLSYHRP